MTDKIIPQDQYVAQWRAQQIAELAKANGVNVVTTGGQPFVTFHPDDYAKFVRDVLEFIEREASL